MMRGGDRGMDVKAMEEKKVNGDRSEPLKFGPI
jgi:hypothetical protein